MIAKGVHSAVPIGRWGDDPEHMKDCYYEADHVLRALVAAGYVLTGPVSPEVLLPGFDPDQYDLDPVKEVANEPS